MGKKKKIVDDGETKSAKENTIGKPSASKKIRLEIPRDTWVRLEAYIKNYNKDPERLSPKTDTDRVIFEALAAHLASSPKG